MKTVKVVAAVIKAVNKNGEDIIFATQRGYGEFKDSWYGNDEKIECVLEWNKGNHFQDVDVRCGKGFLWCMGENICKINNCKTNMDRTML